MAERGAKIDDFLARRGFEEAIRIPLAGDASVRRYERLRGGPSPAVLMDVPPDQLDATLINMRFVKPLDEEAVLEAAAQHELLVTLEDNAVAGGAGSAVNECLARHQLQVPVLNLGIPDRFIEHASREEMLAECGLDVDGIAAALRPVLEELDAGQPAAAALRTPRVVY